MSKKLILAASMALVLAACGDKDDAATGEPSMMDKAMDATTEMASDTAEAVKDTTGDVVEGAGDMASDAVDATKEMVHDTAQSIVDATADDAADAAADAATDAATDAAAGAMDDASKAMGQ